MDFKTKFLAYQPQLTPLPGTQGGGFKLILEIPENQYPSIKELNDPTFKDYEFVVSLKGKRIS